MDTKKKELVGNYKNAGRGWHLAGEPTAVHTHDFPDADPGKAIPYGIYDLTADAAWVNVGTDHDTAAFAVESIRRWRNGCGRDSCPASGRLLITADAGGSHGYRSRTWKFELAALAALAALAVKTGPEITACHMPPGTSKRNKIEHRHCQAPGLVESQLAGFQGVVWGAGDVWSASNSAGGTCPSSPWSLRWLNLVCTPRSE